MDLGRPPHRSRTADYPGSWVTQAACRGQAALEPLFFPERGVSVEPAKAICATCPVRVECLEFALDSGQAFGVWGGLSVRERERIRRSRSRRAAVA